MRFESIIGCTELFEDDFWDFASQLLKEDTEILDYDTASNIYSIAVKFCCYSIVFYIAANFVLNSLFHSIFLASPSWYTEILAWTYSNLITNLSLLYPFLCLYSIKLFSSVSAFLMDSLS